MANRIDDFVIEKMNRIKSSIEHGDNILKDDKAFYNKYYPILLAHYEGLVATWQSVSSKLDDKKADVLKPSNFKGMPMSSVKQNSEHECVARNIMVFLARTGDTWRQLTWEEYVKEYNKDCKGGSKLELDSYWKRYFDNTVQYTKNPGMAASFSPAWESVYNKVNK